MLEYAEDRQSEVEQKREGKRGEQEWASNATETGARPPTRDEKDEVVLATPTTREVGSDVEKGDERGDTSHSAEGAGSGSSRPEAGGGEGRGPHHAADEPLASSSPVPDESMGSRRAVEMIWVTGQLVQWRP